MGSLDPDACCFPEAQPPESGGGVGDGEGEAFPRSTVGNLAARPQRPKGPLRCSLIPPALIERLLCAGGGGSVRECSSQPAAGPSSVWVSRKPGVAGQGARPSGLPAILAALPGLVSERASCRKAGESPFLANAYWRPTLPRALGCWAPLTHLTPTKPSWASSVLFSSQAWQAAPPGPKCLLCHV